MNLEIFSTNKQGVALPLQAIKDFADKHLVLPQVECPLKHRFVPGVYIRELFIPANTFVIGNEHRTEHLNIMVKGKMRVFMGDEVKEMTAPETFVSKENVMKIAYVLEDMTFLTIHPTDETDIDKLEEMLFIKTEARKNYEAELKRLPV